MNNETPKADLPAQQQGAEKNIEELVETSNEDEAKQLYTASKKRLLNVNNWNKICGKLSAVFELTNSEGHQLKSNPVVGNYFKIDIPGPGTVSGKGYDWVRVEAVEEKNNEDEESILIRVRPSDNPTTADDDVAHFFSDKATSNFFVSRKNNVVTAAVYGRNEVANTSTSNAVDKARNAVVGTSAKAGLSDPQWKALVKGVLGKS